MAKAAGRRWCAMCIIRNWCSKGFWAPNGDEGTGKPGTNKPPHVPEDNPPNFLQLWPLILAHFHLLIGVLEIICISWEREQSKEVAPPVGISRFTSRRFESSRETELSTHRCVSAAFERNSLSRAAIQFVHPYLFHSYRQHQSYLH